MNILALTDLHVQYGKTRAVRGVSLRVQSGAAIALVGSNGAGKSSTLKAIMGLAEVTNGTVEFEEQDLLPLKSAARVRRGIALVPEGRRIFGELTVRVNLELGFVTGSRQASAERIEEMLALFPILRQRYHQLGGTLSGGEQQMLAIARALMSRPKLLLLDEPTLGLAPVMVERLEEILGALRAQGLSMLLAEQNVQVAFSLSDYGYVLEQGELIREGASEELRNDDRIRLAYLGL